jgi:transposase
MSDAQFELICDLVPTPKARGRKLTDLRIVLNALVCMIRASCPWRLTPKDFSPLRRQRVVTLNWRRISRPASDLRFTPDYCRKRIQAISGEIS